MHRTAARLLLSLSTKLALTVVAAGHAPAAAAEAEPPPAPWSLPFLTAPPADVARAAVAHRGAVGERGYGCIRVEHDVRFEPDGRAVETMRSICHFTQAEAVQRDGVETIHYAPSVQERPAIRGRVITPDGQAVPFDTTSAVESGAHPTGDGAVLHDLRALRLPLPRLSVGAVVELERVVARHVGPVPVPDLRVPFPTGLSIERYAISFDAPASAGLSVGTNLPEGTFDTQTRGERVIHRLSAGNTGRVAEPAASGGASAPAAAAPKDLLAHASGWRNWQHAATWYGAQVDAQIAAGPAPAELLAGLPRAEGRGKNALDVLERLGERLAPRLRYVSIAVGASGLIPTPPAEALQRGFADCKDMATLLVSALRSLGFEAHVALLTTSGHAEAPDAPAILALFDHAIVAVRTPQGLRFVDLTRPDAPPEALPDAAAGRRVLVAAPTTRALTVTPMPTAAENLLRAEATLDLTNPREWVRRERMLARGQLVVPIRERMAKASNVAFHTMSRTPAGPFATAWAQDLLPQPEHLEFIDLEFDVPSVGRIERELSKAGAHIPMPVRHEIRMTVTPPAGWVPERELPALRHEGERATLEHRLSIGADGVIVSDAVLEVQVGVVSEAEAASTRALFTREAWRETGGKRTLRLVPAERRLLAEGRTREAAAVLNDLVRANPTSLALALRKARFLADAGLVDAGRAALASARRLAPDDGALMVAHAELLTRDALGRDRLVAAGNDVKAMRAAAELLAKARAGGAPASAGTEAWEAILRLVGDDGRWFTAGAQLAEAVALFAAVAPEALSEVQLLQYAAALLHLGDADGLAALAGARADGRVAARAVAATALKGDTEAAWRQAERLAAALDATPALLAMRGASLVAFQGDLDGAAVLSRRACPDGHCAQAAREDARRIQSRPEALRWARTPSATNPEAFLGRYLALLVRGGGTEAEARALFGPGVSERARQVLARNARALAEGFSSSEPSAPRLAPAFVEAAAAAHLQGVLRVEGACPGLLRLSDPSGDVMLVVDCEGARPRLSAASLDVAAGAEEALRALAAGKVAQARTWLAWSLPAGARAPLTESLRRPGLEPADIADAGADTLPFIAGLALVRQDAAVLPAVLDRLPPAAADTPARAALRDLLLAEGHDEAALEAVRRSRGRAPGALGLMEAEAQLLWELQGLDVGFARLKEMTTDPHVTPGGRLVLTRMAAEWAGRLGRNRDKVELLRATDPAGPVFHAIFLNELAWGTMVLDGPTDEALALARRLIGRDRTPTPEQRNTLATILAERGEAAEALEVLSDTVAAVGRLQSEDDLVLGRVAEAWGLPDAARLYYGRIPRPENPRPGDPHTLAQRRLSKLDAADARDVARRE